MANNTTLPGTGEVYASEERGGSINFQKALFEPLDGPGIDAFGRLRVSNPTTLFESKLLSGDKAPLWWDEALESGAAITSSTPTAAKPYIDISSTNTTAGVFTRQTFQRFNYQPGKSFLHQFTGVLQLSGGGTGVQRRLGYFDDDNGAFFEDDSTGMGVVIRSNDTGTPIDTRVAQASWNLDKMDGSSNPSGITADWTKGHIFVIDFQWLSLGRVRFGIEVDGRLYYVHQISNANVLTIPWSSTPNLPMRAQIVTTSSSPASSMRQICASVISEGGAPFSGVTQTHGTTAFANANIVGTVYALVGIRLKSDQLGCTVDPLKVAILNLSKEEMEWQLIHNPTVAGTFAYGAKTNSCVEVATGDSVGDPSTNTVTNGIVVARGYTGGDSDAALNLENLLRIGSAIDGTRDTLVLAVNPLKANIDAHGSLTWRET